jgi:hypothetical protein
MNLIQKIIVRIYLRLWAGELAKGVPKLDYRFNILLLFVFIRFDRMERQVRHNLSCRISAVFVNVKTASRLKARKPFFIKRAPCLP